MSATKDLGGLPTASWENLQTLVDSLEKAWQKGEAVDVAELLPPPGTPARALILQELIKTDLECRWRHGQKATLDDYLTRFPAELGSPEALPAELIYEEYRVRRLFGDRPALEQVKTRFPRQFEEVERLLQKNPLPTQPASSSTGSVGPAIVKNMVLGQTGCTLLKRIGTGGFAEVWKVQAPGGVLKAIKIIVRPIDQEETKREAEAMELIKNLRHHFLLPIHSIWALEDRLIILMDLADGSLRDCLNQCKKKGLPAIPGPELLRYICQSAEALDYLHSKKVQHRDIKPENILLTENNARVADFGLAKAQGTARMAAGTFAGTPMYMPPETWQDKTHVNGDQYSLAATYLELRTGRGMFKNSGLPALMSSHLNETPRLDPLGEAEQRVLLRALAKNPEDRFPDCQSFARALEKALQADPAEPQLVPGAAGSSIATQNDLQTLVPGQTVKPAGSLAKTYRDQSAPDLSTAATVRRRSILLPALLVLAMLAVAAGVGWVLLRPSAEAGDLTLVPSEPRTVQAGATVTIPIVIKRESFNGPVQLKFSSDPDIHLDDAVIPENSSETNIKVRVDKQASAGIRHITLEAWGGAYCAYQVLDFTVQGSGG